MFNLRSLTTPAHFSMLARGFRWPTRKTNFVEWELDFEEVTSNVYPIRVMDE